MDFWQFLVWWSICAFMKGCFDILYYALKRGVQDIIRENNSAK
jgi:hypothetical protein